MTPARRALLALTLTPLLPAMATPAALAEAVRAHTGGAALLDGGVAVDIADLVENGNTVPVTVRFTGVGPVRSLALFTERNPQPDVAVFHLSPRASRAEVATRMRLATSQQLVAVATGVDGRCWHVRMDVLVTLAACIE